MPFQPRYGPTWLGEGRVRFRVWSPASERVDVLFEDGRELHLTRGGAEHSAVAAGVEPGCRYRLRLDGEGPFPDPWSRHQPDGVHGPSAVVAPGTQRHRHVAVPRHRAQATYEMHVGTFTAEGTYRAAAARMDELAELGVDTVQVMPLAEFPGRWNWGYDGVFLHAPTRAYGSPADLGEMVAAAHRAGLAVILDVVFNHLGPDGAYLHRVAPQFFDEAIRTPWGGAVAYDRDPVRRTVVDAARWWIAEYGFDGLRLDATHAIYDQRRPHVLADVARAARRAYRRAYVVAEDERNERAMIVEHRLDAVISDDFHHAVRVTLTGQRDGYFRRYQGGGAELAATIGQGWLFEGGPGQPKGTPAGDLPVTAFVFHLENHDQVGNRADGLHLAALAEPAAVRAATALLLLVPERVLLFQGQEWGSRQPFYYFTDHHPELGRLVTEGRRREFRHFAEFRDHPERIPDPQDEATFRASVLDWSERRANGDAVALHRDLLRRRRTDPVLRRPQKEGMTAQPVEGGVLVERRFGSRRRLLVAFLRPGEGRRLPPGRVLVHTEEARFGGSGQLRLDAPVAVLISPR